MTEGTIFYNEEEWLYELEKLLPNMKIKIKQVVVHGRIMIKTLVIKPKNKVLLDENELKKNNYISPIVLISGLCSDIFSWNRLIYFINEFNKISKKYPNMSFYIPILISDLYEINLKKYMGYNSNDLLKYLVIILDKWRKCFNFEQFIIICEGFGSKIAFEYILKYSNIVNKNLL